MAAASHDGVVRIWRATDGRLVHTLGGHTKRVGDVAFSPDGTVLALANDDEGTIELWSVGKPGSRSPTSLPGPPQGRRRSRLRPTEESLASVGVDQ